MAGENGATFCFVVSLVFGPLVSLTLYKLLTDFRVRCCNAGTSGVSRCARASMFSSSNFFQTGERTFGRFEISDIWWVGVDGSQCKVKREDFDFGGLFILREK